MSDKKKLKLIFNEKEIETPIFLTLDNLISFFKKYFSIKEEPNKYLSLFYYDEDGDQVTVESEVDYKIFIDESQPIIEGELLEKEKENEGNSIDPLKSGKIMLKKLPEQIDNMELNNINNSSLSNNLFNIESLNDPIIHKQNNNTSNKDNNDLLKEKKDFKGIINKSFGDNSKEELIKKMKRDMEEMKKNHEEELKWKFKELKEELNNTKKIIEEQQLIINNLQNKLNSTNIQLKQMESLQSLISKKDKELNNLKQQLRNMTNVNFNNLNNSENIIINKNNFKCVNFISSDQRVNFAIPCSGDSIFAEIEEKLYRNYPEYRETNNTFISDGKQILRFKTINDNRVGTGFPVLLIKPE